MCSPLRRCLQTARRVLDTQKLKQNGVNLIVFPQIREGLSSQCDFPGFIRESIKEFSEFDFSNINESLEKYGSFFIADYLDNKKAQAELKELSKKVTLQCDHSQVAQLCIDLLKKGHLSGDYVENRVHMYTRVQRFKKFVKNFIEEKQIKDGELIIVAHSNFSRAWTAKDIDTKKLDFIDCYSPKNGEIFESEI